MPTPIDFTCVMCKQPHLPDEDCAIRASSSNELLPCPFCGREPKVSHRTASDEGLHAGGYVAFISCACGTYSAKAHQPGGGNTVEEAIDSAAKQWNTRAR